MSKKIQLKDLITKIDWIKIGTGIGYNILKPNVFMVGFCPSSKNKEKVDRVILRIGKDILNKLKWEAGDRLLPFHHPDDLLSFMIVKSKSGDGNKLTVEPPLFNGRFVFTYQEKFILTKMKVKEFDYLITKEGNLVFRVTMPEEE